MGRTFSHAGLKVQLLKRRYPRKMHKQTKDTTVEIRKPKNETACSGRRETSAHFSTCGGTLFRGTPTSLQPHHLSNLADRGSTVLFFRFFSPRLGLQKTAEVHVPRLPKPKTARISDGSRGSVVIPFMGNRPSNPNVTEKLACVSMNLGIEISWPSLVEVKRVEMFGLLASWQDFRFHT